MDVSLFRLSKVGKLLQGGEVEGRETSPDFVQTSRDDGEKIAKPFGRLERLFVGFLGVTEHLLSPFFGTFRLQEQKKKRVSSSRSPGL